MSTLKSPQQDGPLQSLMGWPVFSLFLGHTCWNENDDSRVSLSPLTAV